MSFDKLLKKQEARKAALGQTAQRPGGDKFERFRRNSAYRDASVPALPEIDRILSLPIEMMHTKEQAEEFSRRHLQASEFERGARFFATQSSALDAFDRLGAGFFPIGVGFGKTGISLYAAELAHAKGVRKIMLLLPSQVYAQLVTRDIPFWRRMVNLSVPILRIGGQSMAYRRMMYRSGKRGLYIVPYSLLSATDTLEMLAGINPDLVIADEVHNLKNKNAARTKRLLGWREWKIQNEGIDPALLAMSGTITSKSIEDYHHLISWALGDGSPLPKGGATAQAWAQVIDSGSSIMGEFQTGPLKPLVRWASKHFSGEVFRDTVSDFRRAFKLRLTSAPGVVTTGDAEVDCSLVVETLPVDEPSAELTNLMVQVKEEMLTPNGDEIDCAIHTFKWLNELSAGFYNELVWPTLERIQKRYSMDEPNAKAALALGKEYHGCQQLYHKKLREFLADSPLGCDTPMEVARQINQQPENMPSDLVGAYNDMRGAQVESEQVYGVLIEREGHAHRVDPYKVEAAVDWAFKTKRGQPKGCILWVSHIEVGQWLAELARKRGKDRVLYCPAGDEANATIIDPANADKVVIASMSAHGVGKNLQHFQRQLFVQWPRDAKLAEQVLGRLHRSGQQADEITAYRFDATGFDAVNFAATLNDAVYIHQSTDLRQKLVYAAHNPLPRVFSPEFLREQGADPKALNPEQREMMEELFGASWEEQL